MALVVSIFYYLTRRAPGGDASVGWALGLYYTAGLAGIILMALLLRSKPALGLVLLAVPLAFLALPRIRRTITDLYTRLPVPDRVPRLLLFIENNTPSSLHIKLECWFGTTESHTAQLYTTLDYYTKPLEKSSFRLTAHQTRLLAHKSKYVSIMTFEQVMEEHQGHQYIREIQPCVQFYEETPEAFRAGEYKVVINPK